jgi:hypothetical protein
LGPKNAFWPPEAHFLVKNQLLGPESAFCAQGHGHLILGPRTCISATVSRGGFCEKNEKTHGKYFFRKKVLRRREKNISQRARRPGNLIFRPLRSTLINLMKNLYILRSFSIFDHKTWISTKNLDFHGKSGISRKYRKYNKFSFFVEKWVAHRKTSIWSYLFCLETMLQLENSVTLPQRAQKDQKLALFSFRSEKVDFFAKK